MEVSTLLYSLEIQQLSELCSTICTSEYQSSIAFTFFFKLIFTGVELFYHVVLISTVQQSEPAIHTSISPTEHHNNILSYST